MIPPKKNNTPTITCPPVLCETRDAIAHDPRNTNPTTVPQINAGHRGAPPENTQSNVTMKGTTKLRINTGPRRRLFLSFNNGRQSAPIWST